MVMHEDVERILISEQELDAKVSELAEKISRDYAGKTVLVVTLLKGGVMFAVDLMRKLTVPVEIDFMSVSSYGASSKSSGIVKVDKDLDNSIKGKDVLLVEDIIDSGLTLNYVRRGAAWARAASPENLHNSRQTVAAQNAGRGRLHWI